MRRVDGRLVLSATDLTKHVACPHVTTLDLADLDPAPTLLAPQPKAPEDALALVFLILVAQRSEALLPEQRVVLDVDLRVQRDDVAVLRDDQRVDLD